MVDPMHPSQTSIGWIGTGVMGAAMCGHLLNAGYAVTVYTRSRAKAQPLLDRGASWAETSRRAAAASPIIVTMVGFPADVRDIYFGEQGILAGAQPGSILIDMTTTEPSLSRATAVRVSREKERLSGRTGIRAAHKTM